MESFFVHYSFGSITVPIFLVVLATLSVGLLTLLRNRFTPLYLTFLAFTLVVSSWQGALIFLIASRTESVAVFWSQTLFSLIAIIPCFLYAFTTLLNRRLEDEKYYLGSSFGIAFLLAAGIFFTPHLTDGVYQYSWGFYPRFGSFHYLFLIFFALCISKVLHVFVREILDKTNPNVHLRRNKTLMMGTLIGYLATVDLLPYYGYSIFPFGFLFILAGVAVYAFAISEYELTGLTDDRIASEIFMTIEEAVFVTDAEGTIKLANDATQDLLGDNGSKIEGRNISEFLPGDDDLNSVINTGEVDEAGHEIDSKILDQGNNEYHVRLKISTILGQSYRGPVEQEWYVFAAQDTTKLKEAQSKLDQATYQNSVTGLPNERMLDDEIEEFSGDCGCAVFVIIQDLKTMQANINGQESFRFLIRSVASRLQAVLPSNHYYQVNESEFFAFTTEDQDLAQRFQDWKEDLTAPINLGDEKVHVNYAIGVVEDRPLEEAYQLSQSMAVNEASSKSGTAISRFNEEISREHRRYFEVKHEILEAIQEDQITVSFHPQVTDGGVRGAEALLRWEHDEHGFVAPPQVVQAACEMNYEKELLEHVLSTSMEVAGDWENDEILSVNVSSKHLQYEDRLINVIRKTADSHDFPLRRLEVELTEQAAVRDIDETREILTDLRSHGISVSIDDFGTGYSSFTSLVKLPVDNLKIDKSFVLNLHEEEQNKRIVEATGQLAHGLELDVIAEGVETEDHIGYLRELGITLMQGFYWTEPLKAQEYQQFVQSFSENGENVSGD